MVADLFEKLDAAHNTSLSRKEISHMTIDDAADSGIGNFAGLVACTKGRDTTTLVGVDLKRRSILASAASAAKVASSTDVWRSSGGSSSWTSSGVNSTGSPASILVTMNERRNAPKSACLNKSARMAGFLDRKQILNHRHAGHFAEDPSRVRPLPAHRSPTGDTAASKSWR